jgi:hypothetical protein
MWGLVLVSVLLVVLVVMVAGIIGYLLSGGRYQSTTLKSTGPLGDMITVIDKFSGAVRVCIFEGDKLMCRQPETIYVPAPKAN